MTSAMACMVTLTRMPTLGDPVMSDALRGGALAIPENKLQLYAQTLWRHFTA